MFTHFSEAARHLAERLIKEKQKNNEKKKNTSPVKKEKRKKII